MKITSIILLLGCLQLAANTTAQERITIREKGASILKIFGEIQRQTGYSFLVTHEIVKTAKPVDIEVTNMSLKDVLTICFKNQPLEYSISGKVITISVKKNDDSVGINAAKGKLITVRGKVLNENGEPISGATVAVKETNKTTVTDGSGVYTLEDVLENAVILITSVGFDPLHIAINGRTALTSVLRIKITSLDELQVIGYGQSSKRLNTGNVSTVKSTDIEKQPVNNPLLALQGRVPGMEIQQTTGVAGGGVRVQIRGTNSLSKGTDPLFIVDGVPFNSQTISGFSGGNVLVDGGLGNPFNFLNPNDIESIDVLKDADATAIYGSRGANGVVLITTKKGKAGATKLDINLQSGFAQVPKKQKLLNTRQYLDMRYEAFKNDGAVPNPSVDYDLTLWDTTRYTDWQEELIGGTARYHDLQASLSGGNANTQYLFGGNFHKETTVFPGNFNDQKGSVHINLSNTSMDKKFHFNFSGVYNLDNNRLGAFNFTQMALQLAPNAPPMYNDDGSLNWAPNDQGVSTWPGMNGNPAATTLSKFYLKTNNLVANATFSYELLKGLQLKTSAGYNSLQMNQYAAFPLSVSDPSTWAFTQRTATFGNNNSQSLIIEPQVIYNREIARGTLSLLAGFSYQQGKNVGQSVGGVGFSSDETMEDIRSATTILPGTSINSIYRYNAGFGRINYNWQNTYIINLSARRDGSSRFGPANRFHNFAAVGAAWIFSNEKIVQTALPKLSYGKLRGSYGTTGNDQIGDYSYLDLYSNMAGIGVPYQGAIGLRPSSILTPDLEWEETKKLEAGISLGWFKDRLLVDISFYRNRSSNQIVNYALPLTTGFNSISKNLDALIQNKGWEFEVRTINFSSASFKWSSSVNLSFNRNKLLRIASGVSADLEKVVGNAISSVFVYHSLGVDPITGIYKFLDNKGAETYTPNPSTDRNKIVNTETRFFGGLTNSLSYKGIQLDFLLQFVKRPNGLPYQFNYLPGYYSRSGSGSNQPVEVLNRWQQAGDVKEYQRYNQNYSLSKSFENIQLSDKMYGDASFIRLRNVSISWQVPQQLKNKTPLKNLRIYVQGQNLHTFTKYRGLDPETQNSVYSLPPLRTVTGGIQFSL